MLHNGIFPPVRENSRKPIAIKKLNYYKKLSILFITSKLQTLFEVIKCSISTLNRQLIFTSVKQDIHNLHFSISPQVTIPRCTLRPLWSSPSPDRIFSICCFLHINIITVTFELKHCF